jgi:hypothetical protein
MAEYKAAQRARDRAKGIIPTTVEVPAGMVSSFRELADACRRNPHLEMSAVPLRDARTGKLVSLRAVLKG